MPRTSSKKQLPPRPRVTSERGELKKGQSTGALGDAANEWLAKNRSLVLRQSPVWAKSLAVVFTALGTIAVVGGFLFRIDEVVTVQGQLNAVEGSTDVMTPSGGQVAQVFFKDGEFVPKGKLLLKYDTTAAAKEAETLTLMISLETSELEQQLATFVSRTEVIKGQRVVLEKKIKTKTEILDSLRGLVESGAYTRLPFLEQTDELLELQAQLNQLDEELQQLTFQATQLRLESERNISQMRNSLVKANLQLQYQNVEAPVAGIVFDPKVRPQSVLQPGETILTLVPQDSLHARVFIPNMDIGFVKPGQEARVRIDAFPFARYGDVPGIVEDIGADALPPDETNPIYRFPARISLKRPYLETRGIKIPLRSGMAVTTNLKLRDKPVISLLSDLLVDQLDAVRSIRQQ